jgi:hypothetical protein
MGEVSTIGLDIAKSVFQIHGVDVDGAVVMRKRISRARSSVWEIRCAQGDQHRKASNCGEDPAHWLPLDPLPGDEHAGKCCS